VYAFFALLPGVLADGVTRILWNYQTTRGRLYWRLAIASTVVNLVAVVLLARPYGAVGAALASSISYGALAVFVVRRFCADTGLGAADVVVPQRSDLEVIVRTARGLLRRG
jgi:O-antigen/teichoic acid export membrane protein